MTDGTAEYNNAHYRLSFFYDLVKTPVIRMAWAMAQELVPPSVHRRCPHSRLVALGGDARHLRSRKPLARYHREAALLHHLRNPQAVGRAVAALAVARWNGQSLSSGQLTRVYGFTDLDGSQPDAWRYLREVTLRQRRMPPGPVSPQAPVKMYGPLGIFLVVRFWESW